MTRIKFSPIFFCLVMFFSLVSSIFSNIQNTDVAHGLSSSLFTYEEMAKSPYNQTLSYEFYKALSGCISNNKSAYTNENPLDLAIVSYIADSQDNAKPSAIPNDPNSVFIKDAEIVASSEFNTTEVFAQIFKHANDKVNIGQMGENYVKKQGYDIGAKNGVVSCMEIAKAAYGFWGLDSIGNDKLLQNIGYKSSYIPELDNKYTIYSISKQPTLAQYLVDNIYAGDSTEVDSMNDGLKYYNYRHYLLGSDYCGGVEYDPNKPGELTVDGTTNTFYQSEKVTMFLEDNSGNTKDYDIKLNNRIVGGGDTAIPVNYPDRNYTCKEIATNLSAVTKRIASNQQYQAFSIYIQKSSSITNTQIDNTLDLDDENTTSCAINGVGWIVCPVVNFLAGIADGAFGFLADNFLSVNTKIFDTENDQYNNTYKAWSMMRNLANILFVIAFLIIIYSQMTGFGMTNYGVKKLLPRLIVAAVLVNISFFICQIAVDISNILGYSLKNFFSSLITTGSAVEADWTKNGNTFTGVAGTILAATGAWFALSAFIPILISAVVALIMILFILVGRQVAIILLIVVSPVAFVAYLLPNTDQWFKKWKKMFTSMLILFPLIALVFGVSNLASAIIGTTLGAGVTSTDSTGNSVLQTEIGQMMSAAVLLLPLFVVPSMLKKSLDSLGSIGTKINGIGTKLGGSPGKALSDSYNNSRFSQFRKYRAGERDLRRSKIQSGTYQGRLGKVNPLNWSSNLNKAINESKYSGEFGNRALTKGYALADAQDDEIMKNAASRISNLKIGGKPLTQAQMMQIATGQNVTDAGGKNVLISKDKFDTQARRVAIQNASKIATVADAHTLVEASTGMSAVERKTLVNSLAGSSVMNKAPYLGGKTLGDIEQGTANIGAAVIDNIANGRITAEVLAGTDKNSIAKIYEVASKSGDPEIIQKLKTAADKIYAPGSRLGEKIVEGSEVANVLNKIRGVDSNNPNNGSFTDGAGI